MEIYSHSSSLNKHRKGVWMKVNASIYAVFIIVDT